MVQRIEIQLKFSDGRANAIKKNINSELGNIIDNIVVSDVYIFEEEITTNDFRKIKEVISNSVVEKISLNSPLKTKNFDFVLEIGFLPGVTDNLGTTARQVFFDTLNLDIKIYPSKIYYIKGNLNKKIIEKISDLLSNKLIHKRHIKSHKEFLKDFEKEFVIPKFSLHENFQAKVIDIISIDDTELIKIGKEGILDPKNNLRRGCLTLDLKSMQEIQKYFRDIKKRNPYDIEIESLAQTWSEHCKHTIFSAEIDEIKNGLYEECIKKATKKVRKKLGKKDFCVSVFCDNSGVIKFDENYLITDKVETHNSPSALDPFCGAITGIVGVNRDTIGCGLGALPIINCYGFCIGDINSTPKLFREKNKKNQILSPKKIMGGVIEGVGKGGNCSGIPTVQGFINFHKNFSGKPLVFVRTIGLMPKKINGKSSVEKKAKPKDLIVVVGGRVGKDGIHGATFSSEPINSKSPTNTVQIGDPITQKKLSDVIIKEARDLGLYNSITDNGAGGLSCSVCEMARESFGCEVDLEKVPLKYPGMNAWEVWVSESQERMTLSIPKNKWEKFKDLMDSRGVEASIIGKFTNTGSCVVKTFGKEILNIDLNFLHNGLPKKILKTTLCKEKFKEPNLNGISIKKSLFEMIGRLNICSIEFVSRQYDHEVGGGSVLKQIVGSGKIISEASVIRPLLDSKKAIGVSQALFPKYGLINPYHMACCGVDCSIKNLICCGVDIEKISLVDNFCWCNSTNCERLGQLKQAAIGCYDSSIAYKTPFISGKDSMFNDFKGFNSKDVPITISILPTLLISSLGTMENYNNSISPEVKFPQDLIYILGETKDELGGSEFYSYLSEMENNKNCVGNNVPKVDFETNKKIYEKVTKLIKKDLISSAIPVNLGGVGVALMKMSIGGNLGVNINLKKMNNLDDFVKLYSESSGRIIITIEPKKKDEVEKILFGISFFLIGKVTKDYKINISGKKKMSIAGEEVEKSYKKTLKKY